MLNVETLTQVVFTTLTGRLSERFGSTIIFTLGTGIFAVFNLFFAFGFVHDSYLACLILRCLGAIGLGLMVPAGMPVNY